MLLQGVANDLAQQGAELAEARLAQLAVGADGEEGEDSLRHLARVWSIFLSMLSLKSAYFWLELEAILASSDTGSAWGMWLTEW